MPQTACDAAAIRSCSDPRVLSRLLTVRERAASGGSPQGRVRHVDSADLLDVPGRQREPLIMRLAWRGGHLVLIAGVAVLLAGTAAGHGYPDRTAIRQGGVVVAWVSGGGGVG